MSVERSSERVFESLINLCPVVPRLDLQFVCKERGEKKLDL